MMGGMGMQGGMGMVRESFFLFPLFPYLILPLSGPERHDGRHGHAGRHATRSAAAAGHGWLSPATSALLALSLLCRIMPPSSSPLPRSN